MYTFPRRLYELPFTNFHFDQGVVTIRMMPRQSSLLCYNSFVQNVLIGCPPSKQLIHVAKYSSRDLMNLGSSENELSSPVQTFPVRESHDFQHYPTPIHLGIR